MPRMSFKNAAEKVAEGHYRLEKGVPVPVDVFLDDDLYARSEEEAWSLMATASRFPGVKRVDVTPDTQTGFGEQIGIVINTGGKLLLDVAYKVISLVYVQRIIIITV